MKRNVKRVVRKPVLVRKGSVTVKIYQGTNRVNGLDYPQFTLTYYEGAQRKRKRFADPAEARREAEFIVEKLSKGEDQALHLSSADRAIYLQALDALRCLNVPLNVAVLEYASAMKEVPSGATLKEAVDFFRKRNPAEIEKRTVRQAADELLAAKRAANLSSVHLKDLDTRLNRIAEAFQMSIASVTGPMLQKWLDEMEGSARTKRNYLAVMSALFRFCIRRKYLPKDALEEIEAVQQARVESGEIEIFTPEEMREILNSARPEMTPWLAIAGFAGLRSAEIQRLDWREVNLKERHIEIKAAKAKTAARRLVPVTDNLAAWLEPFALEKGKVTGFDSWWNQIPKLVEAVNAGRGGKGSVFVWKHNAMRHSFISYRLAAIKNAAEVALEAGNSPQMIFKHYRQLVTEAEAGKWFAIMPEKKLETRQAV